MRSNVSELLEKINRIAAKPGFPALPEIEKDLLKQYLREMYEAFDAVNSTKPVYEAVEEIIVSKQVEPATEQPEPKKKQKSVSELIMQTISAKEEASSVAATINETVKPVSSLNEKVKGAAEIHKTFSTKPLKELIDLNKRYVLVNELFKGDSAAFAGVVQQTDISADYDDALNILKAEAAKYGWDEASQSVRMFHKLVKQRFGVE